MSSIIDKNPPFPTPANMDVILPRTLGLRPLRKAATETAAEQVIYGVYGGRSGNVWCASFADEDEGKAWISASVTFGQPVRGYVITDIPQVLTDGSTGI